MEQWNALLDPVDKNGIGARAASLADHLRRPSRNHRACYQKGMERRKQIDRDFTRRAMAVGVQGYDKLGTRFDYRLYR
jgi:hypothetical protein